ncbi:MAG TPA: efflux transporter outer membrane subunit [Caldimonas sp.]|nr:efflux transporter outer membrane subunit [Caldimonas sp.]
MFETARRRSRGAAVLLLAAWVSSCAIGPDYLRPAVEVPSAYKEDGHWKPAAPGSVDSREPWWTGYGDATLDQLVVAANAANQSVRQAEAQYRQALAAIDAARAAGLPQVGVDASGARGVSATTAPGNANTLSVGVTASWEPDLFGGVRRAVEASRASAEASGDDLAAARLAIQSALAQTYFQLRYLDVQRELFAATNAAFAKSLALTRAQYGQGVAMRSDLAFAEAQLESTQATAVDLDAQRAALEHAIAVLVGRPPAAFSLAELTPAKAYAARLPDIPRALPSELLERRPDIAAAERLAAAANAQIGVARAAYFPTLSLSASGALAASSLSTLISAPTRVWSLGAALAQTLFDGGLRRARSAEAVAAYDATVASYRQTVLTGFQQVEDDLATLGVLDQEIAHQDAAVRAAQLAERLALAQYRGGTVTYLTVITAQTLSLSNERTAVQLRSRQLSTSVALVAALGGGWRAGVAESASAAPLPASSSAR